MRAPAKTHARIVAAVIVLAFAWRLRDHVDPLLEILTPPSRARLAVGLDDASRPGRGATVLPGPVREVTRILRAHDVDAYQMVGRFEASAELQQRLSEGAWPARPRRGSRWVVGYAGDLRGLERCRMVEQNRGVGLADCRR